MILQVGALFGFIAVAFSAYATHGLQPIISEQLYASAMTAARYNLINALVLICLGLSSVTGGHALNQKVLSYCAYCFILGTILFSFSIYISVCFNLPGLMNIVPVGGITIMIGWLLMLFILAKHSSSQSVS